MPRKPCRWRRAAALSRPDVEATRAIYASAIREFDRRGHRELFVPAIREKHVGRVLAQLHERGEAGEALTRLIPRLGAFARWARRERAFIRELFTEP
jgi:hypothetical protein